MPSSKCNSPKVKVTKEKMEEIINRWGARPGFLIEILQGVQDEYDHLPKDALKYVSQKISVPLNQIYHAATFFASFSLKPKGKNKIHVCTGTACHVAGGTRVLEAFERELGIKAGETDTDLNYSLESVRCVGCCGLASVVDINKEIHGQVTTASVPKLIRKLKEKESKHA